MKKRLLALSLTMMMTAATLGGTEGDRTLKGRNRSCRGRKHNRNRVWRIHRGRSVSSCIFLY